MLADQMYTAAPTRKSHEQLYALLFNQAQCMKKKHTVDLHTKHCMVGAMSRDAVLQKSKYAIGPGL